MVTKTRLFYASQPPLKTPKTLFLKGFEKLARLLLYCWHNNNNKHAST